MGNLKVGWDPASRLCSIIIIITITIIIVVVIMIITIVTQIAGSVDSFVGSYHIGPAARNAADASSMLATVTASPEPICIYWGTLYYSCR